MFTRFLFAFILSVLLLSGCGPTPTPVVGEAKDFSTACDKANDGKRISIIGYLRFPDSFSGDSSVVLRLYETSDFNGSPIGVQTEFGSQPNQVEPVQDQYKDSDLQVHMGSGGLAKYGMKVKVSGKVYFPLVGQEFACSLENPLVELAQ